MNGKVVALGAFAAITLAMVAWLLLSDSPRAEDDDEAAASADEAIAAQDRKAAPRVQRDNEPQAEEPAEPARDLALPKTLPTLRRTKPVGEAPPTSPGVEPPPAENTAASRREQDQVIAQKAHETGIRCLEETRNGFPEARGEWMARLHFGPGPNGRVVVRNLELDPLGDVHPELAGCLDRELMRLDLDLPDGMERIVNAPLRLLPEGVAGAAAGTLTPPPHYADPTPGGAPAPAGEAIEHPTPEELPPGAATPEPPPPGEAVAPPPEANVPGYAEPPPPLEGAPPPAEADDPPR